MNKYIPIVTWYATSYTMSMQKVFAKARGLGYIAWQSRHMAYHVMMGLLWAWFLRELWGEFNPKWIVTSVIGSLLPDIEHIVYFLGYGRKESYSQTVRRLIRGHHWREVFRFISTGHKKNTSLAYHNIYTVVGLIAFSVVAWKVDWQVGVVLFGAMVGHYIFDIIDDIVQLGRLNANWKRWGSGK